MTQLFLDNGLTTQVCDTACCSKFSYVINQAARSKWLNLLLNAHLCWLQPGRDLFVVSCREGLGEGGVGGRSGCLRKVWAWFSFKLFVGSSVTKDEGL